MSNPESDTPRRRTTVAASHCQSGVIFFDNPALADTYTMRSLFDIHPLSVRGYVRSSARWSAGAFTMRPLDVGLVSADRNLEHRALFDDFPGNRHLAGLDAGGPRRQFPLADPHAAQAVHRPLQGCGTHRLSPDDTGPSCQSAGASGTRAVRHPCATRGLDRFRAANAGMQMRRSNHRSWNADGLRAWAARSKARRRPGAR